MRLIDADALLENVWDVDTRCGYVQVVDVGDIEDAPTIEPKRKTGKWIRHPEWQADGECGYECDQCGMGSDVDYDFCMKCGAEMNVME